MSKYDAHSIQTLEFKDAIRTRVGMYLGDAGMGGVYQGIREIITNSIDEYTIGNGDTIWVTMSGDSIMVKDNASGVPFGARDDGTDAMIAIYTMAHSGGKFDDKVYKNVAGLHGIGAKAVALSSSKFSAISTREGKRAELIIDKGEVVDFKIKPTTVKYTGTEVTYTPDPEVFHLEPVKIDFEVVKDMCKTWAYLSPGLKFELVDENKNEKTTYHFKDGVVDLLKESVKRPLHKDVVTWVEEDEEGNKVTIAFQWSKDRKEVPRVFTNGLENVNGGTSLTGAKTALTRTVNNLSGVKLSGESVRMGLHYAISASIKNPSFSDQTKTKINNPELRGLTDKAFSNAIKDLSERKPADWEQIVQVLVREEEAEKAAEKAREKILAAEKELIAAGNKRTGFGLPAKAHDATNRTGYRELYLSEGDSASGLLIATRDAATQGIMPLRGKILNTFDLELHEAYENEEVKAIFTLLGSGAGSVYNPKKLKYDKIIIATDSDPDGHHISLLLIALFLRHTPQLIEDGHLFRVSAPFYGVKHSGKYHLLYSDEELVEFEKKYGKQKHLDRFKGLGAMTEELTEKHLMDPNNRKLIPIKMEDLDEMKDLFDTLMGKDIEGRRKLVSEGADAI